MLKKALAYFVIGIGFLMYCFFKTYNGVLIPHPFLFLILGLIIVLGGYAMLSWAKRPGSEVAKKASQTIIDLKVSGEQIIVEFDKCDLKENDYSEEVNKYGSSIWGYGNNIQFLNALDDPMRNVEIVDINQAVLIFQHEKNGKIEKFISPILKTDPTTLRFKLIGKKQTILYVDKRDRSQYYFDFEFLDQ